MPRLSQFCVLNGGIRQGEPKQTFSWFFQLFKLYGPGRENSSTPIKRVWRNFQISKSYDVSVLL